MKRRNQLTQAPSYGPASPRIIALYAVIGLASLNIAAYASLLGELKNLWGLTNTQAGTISSVYFAAYTLAVPILTALTDRVSAKSITLFGLTLLAIGATMFGTVVSGFEQACIAHTIMGFGFAGTYMPGLKAISDLVQPEKLSRSTAFYTSSFTVATGLSYVLVTSIAAEYGWQTSMRAIAIAAAAAWCIMLVFIPRQSRRASSGQDSLLRNMGDALRNRTAIGYSLAYFFHCWELFTMRAWVVAFLAFVGGAALHTGQNSQQGISWFLAPASVAAIMTVLGFFASIIGNELSMKLGRVQAVTLVTLASAALCLAIAMSVSAPYALIAALCMLHGITSLGESASVTAGALGSAGEGKRGATMALHSTLGFAGGFFGPLTFGYLLDIAPDRATGWSWGFMHMAAIIALTAIVLRLARPATIVGDRN